MFNKTTVEVGNTDAEGRIILADAISYASKYKPELIIEYCNSYRFCCYDLWKSGHCCNDKC